MSKEEWVKRYYTDPAFRLERLLKLRKRHMRKSIAHRDAYCFEIDRAKSDLANAAPHD